MALINIIHIIIPVSQFSSVLLIDQTAKKSINEKTDPAVSKRNEVNMNINNKPEVEGCRNTQENEKNESNIVDDEKVKEREERKTLPLVDRRNKDIV